MTRPVTLTLITGLALLAIFSRATLPRRATCALGSMGHGPTVVLVHGLGVSPTHWLPVARNLARDHRVVLVEMPGHGIDEMPEPWGLAEAARALDLALAAEAREPVVLVGHSVGGLIAAAEALRAPGRVRALVLVDTALRPQLGRPEREALLASLTRDYRGTLRATFEAFGRDSAQGARIYAEAAQLDSTALRTWIQLALTADLSRQVPALRMPVLAVLSDRSWPEGESWTACADTLGYAGAKDVEPVRVLGTGHFIMIDRPRQLADLIRHFAQAKAPSLIATATR
jgi:pimeloyl-ACP methyl ester carboxylesterase